MQAQAPGIFALVWQKCRRSAANLEHNLADDKQNPPADFSKLVTQWERNFNEFSNQIMGTPEFAKSMNQFQNMQMEYQKSFSEAMTRQLSNLNMPSRDDVVSMGEQLTQIDLRLSRIEKALEKSNANPEKPATRRKAPARTRKPPPKQEAKGE
ncbi:MAG: hypothetical protein O3C68_00615 [Proteobacteria bacterium]|nr:hypothetical protein [Pseudomonadota bacterium]